MGQFERVRNACYLKYEKYTGAARVKIEKEENNRRRASASIFIAHRGFTMGLTFVYMDFCFFNFHMIQYVIKKN